MISIEHDRDNFLVCRVSGWLTKEDYDAAVPELENALKLARQPLRLMIILEDFRGWDLAALWEDLKFDVAHGDDFGRVAVIGESSFQEWATRLSKPFFGSEMRFYDVSDRARARAWLSED